MKNFLPHVAILEVVHQPDAVRYRARLVGTWVDQRVAPMTGKFLDEVPRPEWRSYVLDRCRGLAASGEPLVLMNDLFLDGWGSRYEALWLPFSDDGIDVNLLVCAMIYGELASES